jgi:hypothetical protein
MSKMVIKQETAVAPIMGGTARGFENFKTEDLILPRLRLLQGLSQAVVDGVGKIGQFQDSLSGEIIGDSMEVVLLGMKNGAVYFEQGEGMRCKSGDGITNMDGVPCVNCPFNEYHSKRWGKDEPPPKCSSTKEFVCITRGTTKGTEQRPIVVSFLKTSFKQGRKLASIARLTGRDIFAAAYVLSSSTLKNTKGTFSVMEVKQNGWLTPEEYKVAESWFNKIGAANVIVHEASEVVDDDDIII